MKIAIHRVAVTLLLGASVVSGSLIGSAQERVDVEGTADFRNPPILADGQYVDTIVTGEAVWYAVLYTNNNPLEITVDLIDVDLDAADELTLEGRFVAPSLDVAGRGLSIGANGTTWSWPEGTTNLWYIQVELATTGRLGVEHQLSLDIAGMQGGGLQRCEDLPDCDLDEALAEVESEIADLEADISELPDLDSEEVVRDEIRELEGRIAAADTELAEAEEAIADLCAPEVTCEAVPEPGASTPAWAIALGVLVLGGGAGLLVMNVRGES